MKRLRCYCCWVPHVGGCLLEHCLHPPPLLPFKHHQIPRCACIGAHSDRCSVVGVPITTQKRRQAAAGGTLEVGTRMARRTRFGFCAVKKEELDDELFGTDTPPSTGTCAIKGELKSSIRRQTPNTNRGGSKTPATSAGGSGREPPETSRYFDSSLPVRGRKRKVAASVTGPAEGSCTTGSKSRRHRGTGDGTGKASKLSATSPSATTGFCAVGARRRSSRTLNAVKKEELTSALELPEPSPSDAKRRTKGDTSTIGDCKPLRRRAAVAAKGEVCVQASEEGKGKKKARTKAKANIEKRGEVRERAIPPRLAEKAALIIQIMDKLYPDPPIPINHLDSFTLLCGVLLSAQTTDAQVNLVTQELFRVAPNPQSLSKMAQEDLQQIIRSVGLAPTKAKHLIALSQQILDRFDGKVPQTFEGLQSLPGVGRKTAAVVMVQAFNTPAFPVDTHIHRLALRWELTKNEKNASKVEEDLMAVFPRDSWAKLHLQFIYFGREHCQARVHDASACPICSWVKKTGPGSPKALAELTCLNDYLASPTPTKKSSKNAIVYSERMLEMEQFRMKLEDS
ncbi:unnamed protein product [Ectocarpus sp. CCAP 1310/34]|nr:unnamed protein product [Ectocarpus sp. CCAP 1310/34]